MELDHPSSASPLERRRFLRVAGAASLAGLFARAVAAAPLPAFEPLWLASGCTLTPSNVEGPFYLPLNLLRQDITEGLPGFEMELLLRVVRASDCSPIVGAVVDVWHANAIGRYSGVAAQGTAGRTFLRGIQLTNASGMVHFHTTFPGWYPSRATHIHAKVRPTPTSVLTTQFYFSQETTSTVDEQPLYDGHGPNPLANADDPFFLPATVIPVREIGRAGLTFRGKRRLLAGFTIAVA